jgi:hypothetical protein
MPVFDACCGYSPDIDQKFDGGLITLMDAKIINKYLAERQTIREFEPFSFIRILRPDLR